MAYSNAAPISDLTSELTNNLQKYPCLKVDFNFSECMDECLEATAHQSCLEPVSFLQPAE
jgi:hypothetical protein